MLNINNIELSTQCKNKIKIKKKYRIKIKNLQEWYFPLSQLG